MAAAEFYATGTRPEQQHQPSFLAPPQPQRASSNPNISYNAPSYSGTPHFPSPGHRPSQPQYPPPPTYEESKPNVHFAPPSHPQRNSLSGQRPPPQPWQQPQPPYGPPTIYNPQPYQYQQPPLPAPHMRPYANQNYSESSLGGYSSDPEPHRRRHKHQEKRKKHISESSRSANTDGFLGAAGGGLIGDLIFPGLGTVGGALAGWIGGKDYGQHRKWREEKRDRDQEEWERRHSRDRSYDSNGKRRSHDRK